MLQDVLPLQLPLVIAVCLPLRTGFIEIVIQSCTELGFKAYVFLF
jgi:hypothetical protein